MEKEYNRYEILNNTTTIQIMPMVKLPVNSTDKFEYWNSEIHRFDKLAYKYYGNPFYDFFILLANPSYVSEYDIPDDTLIRIPFPIEKVKSDYENILTMLKKQ